MLYLWYKFNSMTHSVMRPSFLLLLSEPGRALMEFGTSVSYQKLFTTKVEGDGHPVMILPGFLSSETSTKTLREYVSNLGYDVYDWGMGRNMGKLEYMELLLHRVDEIFHKTGKTISLIGWSLGGVFARQLAKERPHLIRQVITLASPFAGLGEPNNVAWIYSVLNRGKKVKEVNQTLMDDLPLPAPVPTTAIYSKSDGIVPWKFCMEKDEDKFHQNIEVRSSHIGMAGNFSVLAIIADRLTKNKNNWSKFKPKGIMNNKLVYPSL